MVAFDSDVPGLVHDQEVFVELKYLLSVPLVLALQASAPESFTRQSLDADAHIQSKRGRSCSGGDSTRSASDCSFSPSSFIPLTCICHRAAVDCHGTLNVTCRIGVVSDCIQA
jgi:hypothetical protein